MSDAIERRDRKICSAIEWLTPDWPAPPGVRAAFAYRDGGVSTAPWDSLNLGLHVGDDAAAVHENRRRLRDALALPGEPLWLEQVHGIEVIDADSPPASPRGDAVVVRRAGQVACVQVADCLPVLFCSRDGQRVGAAHAGWRGLAGGVLEATVAALAVPGRELLAWMGPAIGREAFEVGAEVRAAFIARSAVAAAAFVANARGRWQCDLFELARQRLAALGVGHVSGGGVCTHSDAGRFFSHRRSAPTGRHAALIWR
jgi:polyphenol oxidase